MHISEAETCEFCDQTKILNMVLCYVRKQYCFGMILKIGYEIWDINTLQ